MLLVKFESDMSPVFDERRKTNGGRRTTMKCIGSEKESMILVSFYRKVDKSNRRRNRLVHHI
jgi:hypothetical protein